MFWLIAFAFLVIFLVSFWFLLTTPTLKTTSSKPAPKVDVQRLKADVSTLSTNFYRRSYDQPETLSRAADWIAEQIRNTGLKPVFQTYTVEGNEYRNVSVFVGPSSPEQIVVGAHYDVYDQFPGADDNASGVAGLLELARIFKENPPAIQIELVAFCLEEPPFFRTEYMGSAYHARLLVEKKKKVKLMIALEMIGYFTDATSSQDYPLSLLSVFYPTRGNFITLVGQIGQNMWVRKAKKGIKSATALPVYSINAPRWIPGIDFSDHLNYWQVGIPAIMVTDTAFYRNKNYHTEEDLPKTLDYDRMALVIQGVWGALEELAK